MSLFSRLFRLGQQEHETHLPLPPCPSQPASQTGFSIPLDHPALSVEQDLEGDIGRNLRFPAFDGFESLCTQFEQQLLELQLLRSVHHEDVDTIKALQSAHQKDVSTIDTLRNQVAEISIESKQSLKSHANQKNQLVSQREKRITELRAELSQQQKTFANEKKEYRTKAEKLLQDERQACSRASTRADRVVEEQRLLCEQVAQRAEEAQGLPRGILRSSFAARPVQPFIVVLIDGDAYKFARDLTQDRLSGGARAAERIRSEVFKCMVTRRDIPLHSKIVVRVFFNASSQRGKLGKDGLRKNPAVHTFMIQFSETHPLFDFLDCGSGRERADTKLKQNFELFIDNPYCRGMFLAVCYDGGFVRMLEPYQHLQDALGKIVLIKAGQVAPGFLSVPLFRFMQFPSIFEELYSLKIGPIVNTLCSTQEPRSAEMEDRCSPCNDDEQEPENLPIEEVYHVPWSHPRRFVRSTATLLGLAYEATLLSLVSRGAMPRPELVTLHMLSLRLCDANDGAVTSRAADEKRHAMTKIKAIESMVRQKKQAAEQDGLSHSVRKILLLTVRRLEEDLIHLNGWSRRNRSTTSTGQ